jgi:hypothetical protein
MTKLFISLLIFSVMQFAQAQNVGIGTTAPNVDALLDISSTTKGVLFPRMTSIQRISINTPPNGLMVFDTDRNELYQYISATFSWRALVNDSYWRRQSLTRSRIGNTSDSVGIGTLSPTEWLDVDGNIRSRNDVLADGRVVATGTVSGSGLQTSGGLTVSSNGLIGGNLTVNANLSTNSDLIVNNAAATLQLRNGSSVNKGFFQLSGDDVRFGTNSGNNLGNVIVRMNGNNRFTFTDEGRLTLSADNTPTINFNSGGFPKASLQVQGEDLTINAPGNKVRISNVLYIDDASNRVGVGTISPTERLHVSGNMLVTGNATVNNGRITGTATGTGYNLLPACYGRVDYVGSKNGGTDNFTCTRVSEGVYNITSAQLNGSSVMMVNPEWSYNVPLHYVTARAYHLSGNTFQVLIFETTDDLVHDCRFSFVAYTY